MLFTLWSQSVIAKGPNYLVPRGVVIGVHSLKIDRGNDCSPEGTPLKGRTLALLLRTRDFRNVTLQQYGSSAAGEMLLKSPPVG